MCGWLWELRVCLDVCLSVCAFSPTRIEQVLLTHRSTHLATNLHTHTHTNLIRVRVHSVKEDEEEKTRRDKREDESFFIDSFHRVGQRQWQQQRRRWWWHDNSSRKVSTWEPQPLSHHHYHYHHHHHHHSIQNLNRYKRYFLSPLFLLKPGDGSIVFSSSASWATPVCEEMQVWLVPGRPHLYGNNSTHMFCSVLFCDDVLLSFSSLYTQTYSRDWEDTSLEEPCLFLNRLCWWHLSFSRSLVSVVKYKNAAKHSKGKDSFFFLLPSFHLSPGSEPLPLPFSNKWQYEHIEQFSSILTRPFF